MSYPVFLDADVLAMPMSRSLILVSWQRDGSAFLPVWSPSVEVEADRALRDQWEQQRGRWSSQPLLVSSLRAREPWGQDVLVRDSTEEERSVLLDTDVKDRHVLASAKASGANVVVSGNVPDFGKADLARLGMSVAHPDLFLASVMSEHVYGDVLATMAAYRSRPPNTPEAIHATLGRSHPRLANAMRSVFPDVEPVGAQGEPKEVFRGVRCVVCGRKLSDRDSLEVGVGPECRRR